MKFLPPPAVNTEEWKTGVRMNHAPDWSILSPGEIARRGKRWLRDPAHRPWFDREDAGQSVESRLAQGSISADEARLLSQWVSQGYCVIEDAVEGLEPGLLDAYMRDLDGVWTAPEARQGLQLMSVRVDGKKREPLDHAELLSWPLEQRLAIRDSQSWRIHYYQSHSRAGFEVARAPRLMRMCHLLLEANPVLLDLTAFKYSSVGGAHQDVSFYHIEPAGYFVGVWLACEDIKPDTGPLALYPGSHRVPMWPGFDNYPQTNFRTCHGDLHAEHFGYLRSAVAHIEPVRLPIKKGDAILLHGLLVHLGEDIEERGAKTRFTIVLHYTIPGANKIHEVEGPFNY